MLPGMYLISFLHPISKPEVKTSPDMQGNYSYLKFELVHSESTTDKDSPGAQTG